MAGVRAGRSPRSRCPALQVSRPRGLQKVPMASPGPPARARARAPAARPLPPLTTLLLGLLGLLGSSWARFVSVDVAAPWKLPATALLPMIGEHLRQQHQPQTPSDGVWKFINGLCADPLVVDAFLAGSAANSTGYLQHVGAALDPVVPEALKTLTEAMLGMGYYAPLSQFHRSLSEPFGSPCGGEAFTVLYPSGVPYCDVTSLDFSGASAANRGKAFEETSVQAEDWDVAMDGTGNSATGVHAVVYGVWGSSSFCRHLDHLQSRITSQDVGLARLSVRHAFDGVPVVSEHTALQGYGVFLDVKNMEYKNMDDSSGSAATESSVDEALAPDEEVLGVHLQRLQRSAQLSEDRLRELRSVLVQAEQDGASAHGDQEVKVWKLKDLGLQLAHYLSTRGLDGLLQCLQAMPTHLSTLQNLRVPDISSMREALDAWHGQSPFAPGLYINNRRVVLSESTFNVFDVLKIAFEETQAVQGMQQLPVGRALQRKMIALALGAGPDGAESVEESANSGPLRIDLSKGGGKVHFLNNLEKDAVYTQMWSKSLRALFQPSWGMPAVARNLYTTICVVDLLTPQGASIFMQELMMWQQRSMPVRFGFVPFLDSVPSEPQDVLAMLFQQRTQELGLQAAVESLAVVAEMVLSRLPEDGTIVDTAPLSTAEVLACFQESYSSEAVAALYHQFGEAVLAPSRAFLCDKAVPTNSILLNGMVLSGPEAGLQTQQFYNLLSREHGRVRLLVQQNKLKDSTKSLYAEILKLSKRVVSRYLPALFEDDESEAAGDQDRVLRLGPGQLQDLPHWLALSTPDTLSPSTAAVFFELTPATADAVLSNALEALAVTRAEGGLALSLVFVMGETEGTDCVSAADGSCSAATGATLEAVTLLPTALAANGLCNAACLRALSESLVALRAAALDIERALSLLEGSSTAYDALHAVLTDPDRATKSQVLTRFALAALPAGARPTSATCVVAMDARVVPLPLSAPATAGATPTEPTGLALDILLVRDILAPKSLPVRTLLAAAKVQGVHISLLVQSAYELFKAAHSRASPRALIDKLSPMFPGLSLLQTTVEPPLDDDDALAPDLDVVLVLDPLHPRAGPRGAACVQLLQTQLRLPFTLVMAPRPVEEGGEGLPRSFYAFQAASLPIFPRHLVGPATGPQAHAPLRVQSLPLHHVLTARLDTPETWNVQSAQSHQDLDNLRCDQRGLCGELGAGTHINYELKTLLVPGQCFEQRRGQRAAPPNGLQLVLREHTMVANPAARRLSDTLVMQTLGYFQLQAPSPGLVSLELAPGRAAELYQLRGASEEGSEAEVTAKQVLAVKSFNDVVYRVFVQKRRGLEHVQLLVPSTGAGAGGAAGGGVGAGKPDPASLWSSLSSIFGASSAPAAVVPSTAANNGTIHIFSLATGQMYERLLRIMMLSVSQQSSRKVKFWLFENYLSPSFKGLAAAMSAAYGFEVAYVTYKWPQWLRAQTQQQRIIWGYKILFLDVLFPLDVDRVIYVDADQVVRGDLAELADLDLQGAPYAYTPFCESREETLGFQFWRHGYWKDHLQGRPYHISALYVVDLRRFREMGVGDTLRGVYDNLSRDPNSLANLDQDLPNYAQHQVPIFSLPQEWLWCETWCSDASKAGAKTIDLCNNPLHKEPKLDMARRVISGELFDRSWVQLDEEIKDLARSHGLVHAH